MATTNAFLTPDVIAREALMILENNLISPQVMNTDATSEFTGAKVGDQITIRKPAFFVAQEFGEVSSSEQPSQQPDINSNVVEAQSRVEQLNKIGVNNEPTDVRQEFQKFVTDSSNSTRDVINAKLRMIDTLKEQNK